MVEQEDDVVGEGETVVETEAVPAGDAGVEEASGGVS